MLKFFRHIRKSLLMENKTGNYFKYAIGEIVLVVIGILIALQINNWNEDRKNRQIEVSILEELLSDSKSNQLSFEEDMLLNQRAINSNLLIQNFLTHGKAYHDSLNVHFGNIQYNTQFSLNTGAYENLKSRGLELISNSTLRKSIINVYDMWYKFIGDLGVLNTKISIEQFNPRYKIYFTDMERELLSNYVSFKPLNYQNLVKNEDFIRLISDQKYNNEYTIQALELAISKIKKLTDLLEAELKNN